MNPLEALPTHCFISRLAVQCVITNLVRGAAAKKGWIRVATSFPTKIPLQWFLIFWTESIGWKCGESEWFRSLRGRMSSLLDFMFKTSNLCIIIPSPIFCCCAQRCMVLVGRAVFTSCWYGGFYAMPGSHDTPGRNRLNRNIYGQPPPRPWHETAYDTSDNQNSRVCSGNPQSTFVSGFSAFMPHGDEDDCCLENVVEEWRKNCENPHCTLGCTTKTPFSEIK